MFVGRMGKPSFAFAIVLAWSLSAHAQATERSGVSFGLSAGGGAITGQGGALSAGWRIGYALTPRVVLLGDVAGFFWESPDPPHPTATTVVWGTATLLSVTAQFLVLPRFWVRPGVGIAQWDGTRYTATPTGQRVTDLEGTVPALHLAVGIDAAASKHSVFDIAFSSFAFSRDREFTCAGALLLGYSYY